MKCLAVNSATSVLSIALVEGEKTLAYFETAETRDQGNFLIGHVQQALDAQKLTYADIDLLAVVTGPGSFTGIRIGLAAVRGFALAAGLPVCGVSSFDLFAQGKAGYKNIVAVESFRDELYFRADGQEPVNLTPEDFAKTVSGKFFVSGDAREKLRGLLQDAVYADSDANAATLAKIAAGRGADAEKPLPFYLREPDVTVKKI